MSPLAESLEVRGSLTRGDMRRFYSFQYLTLNGGGSIILVALLLAIIRGLIVGWDVAQSLWFYAFIVYFSLGYLLPPIRWFWKKPNEHSFRYLLDAEGFHMTDDEISLSVVWSGCGPVYETPSLFIVVIPHGMSHQIPKRVLETTEQLHNFRAFLALHIPKEKFKEAGPMGWWS